MNKEFILNNILKKAADAKINLDSPTARKNLIQQILDGLNPHLIKLSDGTKMKPVDYPKYKDA